MTTQWLNEDVGKLFLRVTIASFILVYGIQKITTPALMAYVVDLVSSIGLPGFVAYGVYLGEVVAPILVIIGWRTKLAAAVMSFTMLIVIFLGHYNEIFPLSEFVWWSIELQMLFLLNCLAVMCLGAGAYAVSRGSRWD